MDGISESRLKDWGRRRDLGNRLSVHGLGLDGRGIEGSHVDWLGLDGLEGTSEKGGERYKVKCKGGRPEH